MRGSPLIIKRAAATENLSDPQQFTLYSEQSDARGSFQGILNTGNWREVNVVYTKAGQIRGGHFHQHTSEVIFILSGRAEVLLTPCEDLSKRIVLMLKAGEGIRIPPMVAHDFNYLEDSMHLQLLDKCFDPANQDLITFSPEACLT